MVESYVVGIVPRPVLTKHMIPIKSRSGKTATFINFDACDRHFYEPDKIAIHLYYASIAFSILRHCTKLPPMIKFELSTSRLM